MSKITRFKCDRCGKIFYKNEPGSSLGIINVVYADTETFVKQTEDAKDLCEDCRNSLSFWFDHIAIDDDIFRQQSPI